MGVPIVVVFKSQVEEIALQLVFFFFFQEICVGILGNMVCYNKVCIAVSNNSVLV